MVAETSRGRGVSLSRRSLLAGSAALVCACSARLGNRFTSADTHPSDYPTVKAVEYFGRLLSERTDGRLGVQVYPGGQLGNEVDTLEITSFGGIDFNRVFLAPLNSVEPMTIPPALPFIFESEAHMRAALDGPIGDDVLGSLEPHGLIGLCFYDSGARNFYNTDRPIHALEDMRGLKLRVPSSDLNLAMVNALGANAVPMPFDEVYQSLAQGVIDGAENNWPSFQSARHFEVARYLSLTNHLLTPEVFVMSKTSWDKLSPGDQAIVRQSAKDSVPFMRKLWDARVAESKQAIAASGVHINEVDPASFTAAMSKVWDEFVTTPQQRDIVDRILAMKGGQS